MTGTPDPVRVDFHLLDRQIVDSGGYLVGKVDDVELGVDDDGTVFVRALLVGQTALGPRIGGALGRWLTAIARRMRSEEDPRPLRIPYEHVALVDSAVVLSVRHELLDTPPLERWLCDHVIGRIPGARNAGE